MGSPLDSGREDDIESTPLRDQREQVGGLRDEGVLEWERTESSKKEEMIVWR